MALFSFSSLGSYCVGYGPGLSNELDDYISFYLLCRGIGLSHAMSLLLSFSLQCLFRFPSHEDDDTDGTAYGGSRDTQVSFIFWDKSLILLELDGMD